MRDGCRRYARGMRDACSGFAHLCCAAPLQTLRRETITCAASLRTSATLAFWRRPPLLNQPKKARSLRIIGTADGLHRTSLARISGSLGSHSPSAQTIAASLWCASSELTDTLASLGNQSFGVYFTQLSPLPAPRLRCFFFDWPSGVALAPESGVGFIASFMFEGVVFHCCPAVNARGI